MIKNHQQLQLQGAAKLLLADSFPYVCEETPACPPPHLIVNLLTAL